MQRIIARLDIKNEYLIKGIHLEGLRKIGDPNHYAQKYYKQGADELIYMDAVASLYGRNNLADIVQKTAQNIFIPLTVGGGVRNVEDVQMLLSSGADKIAINTAAIKDPELISRLSNRFGSQCIVLSVEAKKQENGTWEAYTENGRERSGKNVLDWIKQAEELGAGEILLTSVDREGTRKGFDIELNQAVSSHIEIPLISSGGCGSIEHIKKAINSVDALAVADILHYDRSNLGDIKQALGIVNHKNTQDIDSKPIVDSITIVDYGMGNIKSVAQACTLFAKNIIITSLPEKILSSSIVILPGVGAFANGIKELKQRGLFDALKDAQKAGVKLIGICLGMQMLFDESEEHGKTQGLGLIPGKIKHLKQFYKQDAACKVPHIGWSDVSFNNPNYFDNNTLYYHVHSYAAQCPVKEYELASASYKKAVIPTVFRKDNVIGFQFHPEKSGVNGLQLLKKFLED